MAEVNAKVWINDGALVFPEHTTDLMSRTQNTGICLSGGGTRAMVAAIGQLRGLKALGLLDDTRYISAVSGGTWASGPLLFSTNDEDLLLGPVVDPKTTTLHTLGQLSTHSLGHLATGSLRNSLYHLHGDVPDRQLWIDAVGANYLAPLGLYDPKAPAYYSDSEATVADIRARNPQLAGTRFAVSREDRPFWIANGCIIGPKADTPLTQESPVSLEFTALYTGSPQRLNVTYNSPHGKHDQAQVGGGYIEPFAFGGSVHTSVKPGLNTLPAPASAWTLADTMGVCSSAFAGYAELEHFVDAANKLAPTSLLWPIPPTEPVRNYALGDGGILENYGIIPLLLRGVERIVVFVNTGTPLHPKFHGTETSQWSGIDNYLPALFGYVEQGTGIALQNNHVFKQSEFQGVVDQLVAARKAGSGLVADATLTVVDNPWWGLKGGHTVEVVWVYNDRVSDWEHLVHGEVLEAIKQGRASNFWSHGPLEKFPNYDTMGENALELVELTNVQINALADLSCWVVTNNAAVFKRMLGLGSA